MPAPDRVLRWLGLAEPPTVLTGHPRIRARVLADLQQRRRRDHLVTTSAAIVLLAVVLGIGIVRSPLLSVESVALRGLDAAQEAAVAEVTRVAAGANVLDVDLEALESRVEGLPWVADATARRRLPSTVEVRVATSEPVAAAVVGETRYLLDATGTAIEAGPTTAGDAVSARTDVGALPVVELDVAPVVGQPPATAQVRTAAAVAASMPLALRDWVVAYRPQPGGEVDADLRVPTETGPLALVAHLGRPEDIRAKAAALAALVDEAVAQQMPLTSVDVRIPDRPVART